MAEKFTYFPGEKDRRFHVAEMKKQVVTKQEMDKALEKLIAPYIQDKALKILDLCCGIGHLPYFLNEMSPRSTFLGIDQTPWLIDEAIKLCAGKKNISFETGDAYDLAARYPKAFDVSINWKTLLGLPHYEKIVSTLFSVTKQYIFLSSPFYDGDIDFQVRVREYQAESGKDDFNFYYNVYSFPRFKAFVEGLGAKNIEAQDFEIGIDLPRGNKDLMGTWTEKLESGKRLQISGAVVMSWKIVRIDL